MSQLNYSSKCFLKLIGMKLKFMEIRIKHIKLPYINFLSCVMIFKRKKEKRKKKTEHLQSLSITMEIRKPSKRNQRLYKKFLKKEN